MQAPSATDRERLAGEEAALQREASLRRIATLVAGGVTPEALFAAVAREVGLVLGVPVVTVGRYELDGGAPVSVVLASREHAGFPVGSRWPLDGAGTREVYEERRPIRIENFVGLDGTLAQAARQQRVKWVVGAPIIVDGAVWGNIYAGTAGDEPIPEDAESRLADFIDLVSTAIANSDAREEVGRLLHEQAALRRVATLVAEGAAAEDLFAAVAQEVAALFGAGMVNIDRYDNGEAVVLAMFNDPDLPSIIASRRLRFQVGSRWPLRRPSMRAKVYDTGRSVREDGETSVAGLPPHLARAWGRRSGVAAPIVVDGTAWGILAIGSKEDEPLPVDTEQRLAAFTELAATAIANANSRDQLAASEARARALAAEQAALRRVATLVAAGAAPNQVLGAIAVEVGRLLGAGLAILSRFDEGGGVTMLASSPDASAEPSTGTRPTIDPESLTAAVMRTGRAASIEDYAEASGPWAAEALALGHGSALGAPVTVDGRLWGAMIVISPDAHAWPPEAERRLAAFTELLATAIANTESRGELAASEARAHELANEQAALRRVATLVANAPASDDFLSVIAHEVASVLNVSGVIVQRYETDGTVVTLGSSFDSELAGAEQFLGVGSRMPRDPGSLAAQVFETHRPARIDDFSLLPGTIGELARGARLGSGGAGPIMVNGELWGKMCVFSPIGNPLPVGAENRLRDFIELIETAIANHQARAQLAASEARARDLADEQAALRRVATLVAQGAAPDELFSAVAKEVFDVINAPVVGINRYEADGTFTIVANAGESRRWIGTRWPVSEKGHTGRILATGQPARQDDFIGIRDTLGAAVDNDLTSSWREARSVVGVPITVEGDTWGIISAASAPGELVPAGTEERLARFTELLATAISNATTRSELVASRARVVSAADETRRRLERDLHDGIQQWLVGLALRARKAARLFATDEPASKELAGLADDLVALTNELREISRGIHPAILSDAGLDDALESLARRSAIRVDVDVSFGGRYDPALEATVYYVAAESITNAVKHAQASLVTLRGWRGDGAIELEIRDDGVGGADPHRGTGLIGLKDRVDTLGGSISFASAAGAGTTIRVTLPASPSG